MLLISRSSSRSSMTESSEQLTEREGESSDAAASPRDTDDNEQTPMSTSYHANMQTSRRQLPFASPTSSPSPTRDIPTSLSTSVPSSSTTLFSPLSRHQSSEVEEIVYVFVYGTLKRGFRNAKHMAKNGIQFIANGVTMEPLALYTDPENRNRPCLARVGATGHQVRGEVYGVKAALLTGLDKFERVPTHYIRESIRVRLDDDTPPYWRRACDEMGVVDSWVYLNVTDSKRADAITCGKYILLEDYTIAHHMTYTPRVIPPSPTGCFPASLVSSFTLQNAKFPQDSQQSKPHEEQKIRMRTSSEIPASTSHPLTADDNRISQAAFSSSVSQQDFTTTRERIKSSSSEVTIKV